MNAAIPDDYFEAVFPLIKNVQLYFKTRSTVPGQNGGDVVVWTGNLEAEAYIEPYSSSLARHEYGLEIECHKRMFMLPLPALIQGMGVFLSDREGKPDFILESLMPWPGHMECLLK